MIGRSRTAAVVTALATLVVAGYAAERLRAADGALLPNGWRITPSGALTALGTLPLRVVEDPSGKWLAVSNSGYGPQSVTIVDERDGAIAARSPIPKTFYGLAFAPDGKTLYASTAADGGIRRFGFNPDDGSLRDLGAWRLGTGRQWIAGLAVAADGRVVYAASNAANELTAVDAKSGAKLWSAKVGDQPYAVAVSPKLGFVYVSDWAGSSVDVVNSASGENVARVKTGPHPNALLVAPDGKTVYVACANDNTVDEIDTATNGVRATLDVAPLSHAPDGSTPDGLALSKDATTLFVADAGDNAVVALDVARGTVVGAIPVGWYPTDILVTRDGTQLVALDGHGTGGHANPRLPHPDAWPDSKQGSNPDQFYVAYLSTGDLERVGMPDSIALRNGLSQARMNFPGVDLTGDRYALAARGTSAAIANAKIKHVIYVIKENRTYDEVLGDEPRGDGDASLAIFGKKITPNIHKLAESFVLLDNFDVDAEVSADGHNWSTAAYSTDYVDKLWPSSYSGRGRDYDFEGSPASQPSAGYIWDAAGRKGLSVRDYGEFTDFATKPGQPEMPGVASLRGRLDPRYHGWDLHITDRSRMDEWLREFRGFVKNGALPALEIVRLPDDHTAATRAGMHTPYAMIADNDLALGRMVDALSHSPYWTNTVVFVLEDDAQAGPDHVSDQRAEALVAGGWIKRGIVDHTHYTTSGMLHTIETILGLAPMSQFDASARVMTADFAAVANATPWSAVRESVDLNAVNPSDAKGAQTSATFDLDDADRAGAGAFNSVLLEWARANPQTSPSK